MSMVHNFKQKYEDCQFFNINKLGYKLLTILMECYTTAYIIYIQKWEGNIDLFYIVKSFFIVSIYPNPL